MPEARVPEGSGHSPLWPAWEQWGWQPGGPGKTLGTEWALLRGLRRAPCCWNRVQIRRVGRTAGRRDGGTARRRDGRTGGASVCRDRGPRLVHCEPWKDGAGAGSTAFTPSWATELAAGHRGVDSHGVPNRRAGRPARSEPWLRGQRWLSTPLELARRGRQGHHAVWTTKQNPDRHSGPGTNTRRSRPGGRADESSVSSWAGCAAASENAVRAEAAGRGGGRQARGREVGCGSLQGCRAGP